MDRISAEKRSSNMQRIRPVNTSPEVTVRRLVCQLGFRYRYRLHGHQLQGRPDMIFPTLRKIIFIHGCFWHSHEGCKLAHSPKSRLDYWKPKLTRNKLRDRRNVRLLRRDGWQALTLWECQTRRAVQHIVRILARFLKAPS